MPISATQTPNGGRQPSKPAASTSSMPSSATLPPSSDHPAVNASHGSEPHAQRTDSDATPWPPADKKDANTGRQRHTPAATASPPPAPPAARHQRQRPAPLACQTAAAKSQHRQKPPPPRECQGLPAVNPDVQRHPAASASSHLLQTPAAGTNPAPNSYRLWTTPAAAQPQTMRQTAPPSQRQQPPAVNSHGKHSPHTKTRPPAAKRMSRRTVKPAASATPSPTPEEARHKPRRNAPSRNHRSHAPAARPAGERHSHARAKTPPVANARDERRLSANASGHPPPAAMPNATPQQAQAVVSRQRLRQASSPLPSAAAR